MDGHFYDLYVYLSISLTAVMHLSHFLDYQMCFILYVLNVLLLWIIDFDILFWL